VINRPHFPSRPWSGLVWHTSNDICRVADINRRCLLSSSSLPSDQHG